MIFLTILSIYSCQLPLEFSMCPVPLASVVFLSLSQFNLVFSPISHTLFHTFLVFVFSLFIFSPGFLSPQVMTIFFDSHFVSWSSWSQTFLYFICFFLRRHFPPALLNKTQERNSYHISIVPDTCIQHHFRKADMLCVLLIQSESSFPESRVIIIPLYIV